MTALVLGFLDRIGLHVHRYTHIIGDWGYSGTVLGWDGKAHRQVVLYYRCRCGRVKNDGGYYMPPGLAASEPEASK